MKTKSKKKEVKEEDKIKKTKVFELKLNKLEIVHLRDMLSILYPSASEKTISQALAESEDRVFEENSLWNKIASLCVDAKVPVEDEAPDYAIMPVGPAPMGVFMLGQEDSPQMTHSFLKSEETEPEDQEQEEE